MTETTRHLKDIGSHYDKKVNRGNDDLSQRIASDPAIVHQHEGRVTAQELELARRNQNDQPWLEALLYEVESRLTAELGQELHPTPQRDSQLFDAGCGRGGPALMLHAAYGCYVTGISISDAQIAYAQKAAEKLGYSDAVTFRTGDMTATELPDSNFDYVWALGSTEHVQDLDAMSREFLRLAKRSGQLVLYVVTRSGDPHLREKAAHYAGLADNWYKTHLHTLDEYIEALSSTGWIIGRQKKYSEAGTRYWQLRNLLAKKQGSEGFMAEGFVCGVFDYHLLLATADK